MIISIPLKVKLQKCGEHNYADVFSTVKVCQYVMYVDTLLPPSVMSLKLNKQDLLVETRFNYSAFCLDISVGDTKMFFSHIILVNEVFDVINQLDIRSKHLQYIYIFWQNLLTVLL